MDQEKSLDFLTNVSKFIDFDDRLMLNSLDGVYEECSYDTNDTFSDILPSMDSPPTESHSENSSNYSSSECSVSVVYGKKILSLSFLNRPEEKYHVRYASEITDSPLSGNVVNRQMKTKKNLSGRYLKGTEGKHIVINLPKLSFDNCREYFIRVSRLTVPYDGISYIHPYPLLTTLKKSKDYVLLSNRCLYFKLTKEDILAGRKSFNGLMLTRLKQNDLKQIRKIRPLSQSDSPLELNGNVKKIIEIFHLKKSILDFRICYQCEQTNQWLDTNIFCQSNQLIEIEGNDLRRHHRSSK